MRTDELSWDEMRHLRALGNLPDADLAISVAREKSRAVSRPSKGETIGDFATLDSGEFGAEIINNGLAEEIPDFDGGLGSSAEPVTVRAEHKGVDDVSSFQRVEMLRLIQIPQHNGAILSTGRTKAAVRREGNGIDVLAMTNMVDGKSRGSRSHVPNFDKLVPSTGDNQGAGTIRGETDSRDPLSVTKIGTARSRDGKITLQLPVNVPDLDSLIAGARDNDAVVGGEGGRGNVTSVTIEASNGVARLQIKETHSLVPRSSQDEATISRQAHVADEMVVTNQGLFGDTKVLTGSGKRPDHGSLV